MSKSSNIRSAIMLRYPNGIADRGFGPQLSKEFSCSRSLVYMVAYRMGWRLLDPISGVPNTPKTSKGHFSYKRGMSLSDREEDILSLIASGLTTDEIVSKLGISRGTVLMNMHHIRIKLGLRKPIRTWVLTDEGREYVYVLETSGELKEITSAG